MITFYDFWTNYFRENPIALQNLIVTLVINLIFNVPSAIIRIYRYYNTVKHPLKNHDLFNLYQKVKNFIAGLEMTLKESPARAEHIRQWQEEGNRLIIEFCSGIIDKKIQRKSRKEFNIAVNEKAIEALNALLAHVQTNFAGDKEIVRVEFHRYLFPAHERMKLDVKCWLETDLSNYEKTWYILTDFWKYFELHETYINLMINLTGDLIKYEKELEKQWKDIQKAG